MECKHERLRTVGDRVFCMECQAELPLEFLISGKLPEELPEETETPAETVPADEIQAEKQPAEKKTGKSPAKRKPRKNAE